MRDVTKHPWVLGDLVIAQSVLDRVSEEARAAYAPRRGELRLPRRARGATAAASTGSCRWRIARTRCIALDPEQYPRTGRMYFDIDSMKFESAIRRGEAEGRPVKVLYHSHLDVGAYFSATDAEVAKMGQGEPPWDLAYLVTSVRVGKVDDRKLFVWDPVGKAFVESGLEVEEGA